MMSRLFVVYAVAELAVLLAVVSAIGFSLTLLVLLAVFVVGLAVASAQLNRQLTLVRSRRTGTPEAASDSALVALGMALVVIPGFITSAAGLLLLLPLTRPALRPMVRAMALRGIGRPLFTMTTLRADRSANVGRAPRDFIDGEVIDVIDVEPVTLPRYAT